MSAPAPQLSVVIPTYNASDTIVRVLEALLASRDVSPEIVVVDDGSTDDTADLVQSHPVTLVRRDSCGGPSAARNLGVERSGGEVIVFIDADVEVGPDTLSRIGRYFVEHEDVAALFGSYDRSPADRGFVSRFRNLLHHFVHQHGAREAATFWCGCGAVLRRVYLELGGLSEGFSRPSIEDIEFGTRVHEAGHRIHLVREIQVKHLKAWSLASMARTDIFNRAIPWTLLILGRRKSRWDLNLQFRHRLSAAAVFATTALLVAGLAVHPLFLLPAAAGVLGFHLLNRDLFRFFVNTEGPGFAVASLPLLLLFYVYSTLAFGAGAVLHLLGKHLS